MQGLIRGFIPVWGMLLVLLSSSGSADSFTRALVTVQSAGTISPALKSTWESSVLYPELVAAATEEGLGAISARALLDLMARHPDHASIANLRWKKLHRLGRAGWHEEYLMLFQPTDSVELSCYALNARLSLKRATEQDLRDAVQLWIHGQSRPKACDSLFAKLETRGLLTDSVRLARIDQALEQGEIGLARWLARTLPASVTGHIDAWELARNQPTRYFQRAAKAYPEWAEMAARNLTRDDPDAMLALINNGHIPQDAKPAVLTATALGMALARDPAAFPLVKRTLPPHPVLDLWRIRYFISQSAWEDVLDAIGRLDPEQQAELEWTYWTSRALAMTGNADLALPGFQRVAQSNSWYGFLAADYLGLPYQFTPKTARPPESVIDQVAVRTDVEVARRLFAEGLTVMARRQWDFVLGRLSEQEQQAAAVLANRWNWYSRSAVTAHQSGLTDDYALRYPLAFETPLTRAAEAHRMPVSLLSGIMRSESLFMHDIKSPAGALGLMQVMPRTGRAVAKRLNIRWQGTRTLINPSANIRIGSFYLAEQLKTFGHPALAAAAYNAGPNRVRQWLPDAAMPLDIWVAQVPFSETRNYIQRVLTAQVIYEWRYTGQMVRLDSLAPPQIPPKD